MATQTIALASKGLESAIEVLSSAAKAFQLTRFETLSYRALVVSVDVAAAIMVASISLSFFLVLFANAWPSLVSGIAATIAIGVVGSVFVGIVSLALNIPLFLRIFRERARLKELGLSSLSKSLWKESRRSRRISQVREVLLIVICISLFVVAVNAITSGPDWHLGIILASFSAVTTALLLTARYLQNQREWMDLTASAEELRKALQSLQGQAGKTGVVFVPAGLLERTAKIESAQIAKERKDAILQSVDFGPTGYAIAFDRDATEKRATLGVADRVELEDRRRNARPLASDCLWNRASGYKEICLVSPAPVRGFFVGVA